MAIACYDGKVKGHFASRWNIGMGCFPADSGYHHKNLCYVFILFYIPFDLGCPHAFPTLAEMLGDSLKNLNCKEILFGLISSSDRR